MEKQHLTYFKIENFKRFDSFEMSNLGQFNLIVGDNNVGKTSVLEALCFDIDIVQLAANYFNVTSFRNTYNFERYPLTYQDIQQTYYWLSIFKDFSKPISIWINGYESNNLILKIKSSNDLNAVERKMVRESTVKVNPDNWLILKTSDTNFRNGEEVMVPAYFEGSTRDIANGNTSYVPFVSASMSYKKDMLQYYYKYFNSDKVLRRQLEDSVKLLIPNLEEIRPHKISDFQEVIGVNVIDSNQIRPLSTFGDGTVRLTRIYLEAMIAENHRLMIDEVGTGIHFTKLKEYWKSLIQLFDKYQVQLFATTHSLECQQAFIEALQDNDMKQFQSDARNITMIEDTEGQVKAITYDFEQFEYAINIGFNTRGGKL